MLLGWVIGGAMALLGAVSYGALARRLPQSGGEYHFLTQVAHPLIGFLAGWVSLLAGFTAPIAAAAAGLQAYVAPSAGEVAGGWIGTAAIVVAGVMHGVQLRGGAALQTLVVVAKLALIAGFVVIGGVVLAGREPPLAAEAAAFDPWAFAETLVWISFSYSGWNAAVYIASEVRDPERTVGRALVLGTSIVVVAYLGLNAVFVWSAPVERLAGVPDIGAVAAFELGGAALRDAVRCIVALALFSSISAMVMAGPRVYARMAEDGVFPALFDARARVPVAAIALQVALAVAVLWITTLRELLTYIGFTLSLSTAGTIGVLLWLRRREGPERVPVPGYPWAQWLFIGATLAIGVFMARRNPELFAAGLVTVLAGVPLYYVLRARSRS